MERRQIIFLSILLGLATIVGAAIVVQTGSLLGERTARSDGGSTVTTALTPTPEVIAGAAATKTESAVPSVTASATAPTASPPPIVVTATPEFFVHVVAAGETVYMIGRRYEISPTTIIELNGLQNPNRLNVGQQLLIPSIAALSSAPSLAEGSTPGAAGTLAPTATTPPPTPTPEPTATATPPSPEPPPEAPPTVNGIARGRVLLMSEEVLANSREIFERGQLMGRNPRAFSMVGDSVIMPPFFKPYDVGNYDLGIYSYLEGVIQHFAGSFARDSVSLRIGLHSWTVFDPVWADKSRCEPNEGPLPCELRLHNPAILIIRLGSNDVGVPDLYESQMRRIVEYAIESGVVPVLGTKADRNEGSNFNNDVVRRLAAEYQVPLWDFDLVAETVPGRGLDTDGVHLDGNGHFMQNVSGLAALDRLWREVIYNRPAE